MGLFDREKRQLKKELKEARRENAEMEKRFKATMSDGLRKGSSVSGREMRARRTKLEKKGKQADFSKAAENESLPLFFSCGQPLQDLLLTENLTGDRLPVRFDALTFV